MTTIATGIQFSQYEDEDLPGELADVPDLDELMEKWFPGIGALGMGRQGGVPGEGESNEQR